MKKDDINSLTASELKKVAFEKSRETYQKARDNGTLKPSSKPINNLDDNNEEN